MLATALTGVAALATATALCRAAPWLQRYDGAGTGDDAAFGIVRTAAGDVIVAGRSLGSGTGFDFVTLAYSAAGTPLWSNRFDGAAHGDDSAVGLAPGDSGAVFVTGASSNGVDDDVATLSYKADGTLAWQQLWDSPHHEQDRPTAIAPDGAGGVVVAVMSLADSSDFDLVVLHYSASGALAWQASYDGGVGGSDIPAAIAVDGSGNVIVTGQSHGASTQADYLTLAYSPAGAPLWTRRYDGGASQDDWPSAMAVDGVGHIAVTGFSVGAGVPSDCLTLSYSSDGTLRWARRFDGPAHDADAGSTLRVDGAGNVYVAGAATGADFDLMLLKYDVDGSLQWSRLADGAEGWDEWSSLVCDGTGTIALTGASFAPGGSWDYETRRYSSSGDCRARARYDGPSGGLDVAHAVAMADSQTLYVTGVSDGGASGADIVTMRLELMAGVSVEPDARSFAVRQIHPNPAGTVATLEFDLPRAASVTLSLYDVAGREVSRVLDRVRYEAGRHLCKIGAASRFSGVYFCRLIADDGSLRQQLDRRLVFIR